MRAGCRRRRAITCARSPPDLPNGSGSRIAKRPRPLDPALGFRDACASLPVVKTRAPGGGEAWRVQVAGAQSRKAALAAFRRLKARHPALSGETPAVWRNPHRRAGGFAVQVLRDSRGAAVRLCARIGATGGACVVYRG